CAELDFPASATRRRLDYGPWSGTRGGAMAEQESESASKAATKGEQAAANVRQARSGRQRITKSSPESVARRYFDAIAARDLDGAVALWADGGRDNVRGQVDVLAPEGVREFLAELLGAVPDLDFRVVSTTSEQDRCAVQWRLTGTFA